MSKGAKHPPVDKAQQDMELTALFGKDGALSRASGGSLTGTYETGKDGISVFTVRDSAGHALTLEGEAATGVNNIGAVWRVGDFSTNSYVPIINPKVEAFLDTSTGKVAFEVKTSAERLAEKISSAFGAFYNKQVNDDTDVLGFFKRELSRTMYAEGDPDKVEAVLSAGYAQSYELQRNLMATTLVGYNVVDNTTAAGYSTASKIQKGVIDQAIGEMTGKNVPLNSAEPFAFSRVETYQENGKEVGAIRPLSGIDVNAVNTRTGYLDMAPRIGPHSSKEIIYHRDEQGNVLTDQNGPIIQGVEVSSAFAKGGAGYIKSKTAPGAGIVPSEMKPVMQEVYDSESGETVKRKVMREVQPQERYDNQPAPSVMRLNMRLTNEEGQENTDRVGEVKTILIAPWTVPGASGIFGDSRGKIVSQYAMEKDQEVATPAFSMLQAESNQVNFDINPAKVIGDVGARPKSRKQLGAITVGDKESKLNLQLAQAKTNISGMYLQVPRYVSDDKTQWSAEAGKGFREVNETDLQVLRNIMPKGFGVQTSNVAKAPTLFTQLSTQVATNDSGGGFKSGFDIMATVKMFRTQGRGKDRVNMPIDMISGEVKQPSIFFMDSGFGARSTAQQKEILSSYLRTNYMRSGAKGKHQLRTIADKEVNDWFSKMSAGYQPGNSPNSPQYGYKMSWEDIKDFLNEKLGTNMNELETGKSVFETVFAQEDKLGADNKPVFIDPSGKKNLENLKKFEIGYTDEPLPLRGIHQDRLDFEKETYRRAARDMGWSDEQIEKGIDKTFQVTKVPGTNVYNGKMVISDENGNPTPFLMMNAAFTKKAEHIGGGGIGPEAGSILYEHDPELAKSMGYDPSEIGTQSPNKRSLLQLRKWLAVEQSIGSGDINKSNLRFDNENTFNIEQGTSQLTELQDALTNFDPKEVDSYSALLKRVSEVVGGENREIYAPSLNAFLPPVNTAANTLKFEEDGLQIGRGGIEWVSALQNMVDQTMNAESGTVNEDAGREIVSGLERHLSTMFDKGGNANKEMFEREIPLSASMRYATMSILGNNQAWMNKETRRRVMMDSGWDNKTIAEFEKSFSRSYTDFKEGRSATMGIPMMSFRWPSQADRQAIMDLNLVPDEYVADVYKQVAKASGEKVNVNEILRNGKFNDVFFQSSQNASEQFGDFDYDPAWFAWLVRNKETDEGKSEFYNMVDQNWQGYRSRSPKKAQEIEENILGLNKDDPNKLSPLVDKVSAQIGAMKDIIAGKDPMKSQSGMGVSKVKLDRFAKDTIAVHENATKGMGSTYNLRRAMEFALESNGFGMTDVADAKAMSHAHYQPYLDKMYNIGSQIEGTALSKMASQATIKVNEKGTPYMQLTTSSEEKGRNKPRKVYFDEKGSQILSAYSFMLNVADKPLVAEVSEEDKKKGIKGTQYQVTSDKLLAALASPSQELYPRILNAIQNENYGTTRSARVSGVVNEWINEGADSAEKTKRRVSVAQSALFKLPLFNALSKVGYDIDGNALPGNFGEGPNQSAFLSHLEKIGFGRDYAEVLQAGAVNLAMLTGGKRGFAPAHIINKALGVARNIMSSKFGSAVGNIPAGIQNMIAKFTALGGTTIADSDDPTWNKKKLTSVEKARQAIRKIGNSATDIDVETTGITFGWDDKMEDTGRIWQVGINGESTVIHPGIDKAEYTRRYELAKSGSKNTAWMEHTPKPEDYDKVFGNAQTFEQLWKTGGLRESILDSESWTSYTDFDKKAILQHLQTARTNADDGEKDYWTSEISSFQKSNYVNLFDDNGGQNKVLGEIFKPEIKRYNEDPEHLKDKTFKPLTNSLQDIAKAVSWEGNKSITGDVFPDEESRNRFSELVGQQDMAHNAGYDTSVMGALRVGAINRVGAFDDAESSRINAANNAHMRSFVPRNIINQRAKGQVGSAPNSPEGNSTPPPADNPPPAAGNKPLRHIRASMMDNDPDTSEGQAALMLAFAGEKLGEDSIPSKESVAGQKVHEAAQKLLPQQDPAGGWEHEVESSIVLGDVEVSGHVDQISSVKNKIIDYKPGGNRKYPFQMKIYEMIHGVKAYVARYSKSQRDAGEIDNAAQGAVNKVLTGTGLEPGTNLTDAQATERAVKIADYKDSHQVEIDELAGKISSGEIKIPTEESKLLPFQSIIKKVAPHVRIDPPQPKKSQPAAQQSTQQTQQTPQDDYQAAQEPQQAQQQADAANTYWNRGARVNPTRVKETREQFLRLGKLFEDANPFIEASQNLAPNTPGSPDMKFFQGAFQAAHSFDVVGGTGRNAVRATVEALNLARKLAGTDDTVRAEAFMSLPDELQTLIANHPISSIMDNSDVNVKMDAVVNGLKGRMTKTSKGAIDRTRDMQIYNEFFGRQDVAAARDALKAYLDADSTHTAKGFFQDVITNRDTSPFASVISEMDKNATSLFSAVEHLSSTGKDVDPLLMGYEDSLDANMKKMLRNPDKLSGWTKQYDDRFYAAANNKKAFKPETLGWKLQMAQEDIVIAESAKDTAKLALDEAVNSGASDGKINALKYTVALKEQGIQKAHRAYRDIELSDQMRGQSVYSDFADVTSSSPFQQAFEAFQNATGKTEDKINAALNSSPEAREAMVDAWNDYQTIDPALKKETDIKVRGFFNAMRRAKKGNSKIFDAPKQEDDILRNFSTAVDFTNAISSSPFQTALATFGSTYGITEEKISAAIDSDPAARKAMSHARELYRSIPEALRSDVDDNTKNLFNAMGYMDRVDKSVFGPTEKSQSLLPEDVMKQFAQNLSKHINDIVGLSGKLEDARGKEAKVLALQVQAMEAKADAEKKDLRVKELQAQSVGLAEGTPEHLQNIEDLAAATISSKRASRKSESLKSYQRGTSGIDGTDITPEDAASDKAAGDFVDAQDAIEKKSMGGFFRHAFGGFGLMYLKNIAGIATSPLESGFNARMQSEQQIGGTLFNILGGQRESNAQDALSRAEGLYQGGQGWEGVLKARAALTRSAPGVMSNTESAVSAISIYGATTWLADGAPNKQIFSGMSNAEWEAKSSTERQAAANAGIMRLSAGVGLAGMVGINIANIAGAIGSPQATARSIATQAANGGFQNGFDPGGMVIGTVSGATLGGVAAGVPGAIVGGLAGGLSSQKNMIAQYMNQSIYYEAQRGIKSLNMLGSGYGVTQASAGYSPAQMSEYTNQVVYSLGNIYGDVSQPALATTVANSMKYGYNFNQDQVANISRQLDRGVDVIGLSRNIPTMAGAGGLEFQKASGKFTNSVQMYKPIKPEDIDGSGRIFGVRTPNEFGIFERTDEPNISPYGQNPTARKFADESKFMESLTASEKSQVNGSNTINIGGQGENLSTIRFTNGMNSGEYNIWGTNGKGEVTSLGATNDIAATKSSLLAKYGDGMSKPQSITVGQDTVQTLLDAIQGNSSLTGEMLMGNLSKLAESGQLNKSNQKDITKNPAKWIKEATAIEAMKGTLEEQAYLSASKLNQARMFTGESTYANAPQASNYQYLNLSPTQLTERLARDQAQMVLTNRKGSLQNQAFQVSELYGMGNPGTFFGNVAKMGVLGVDAMEQMFSMQGTTFGNMVGKYSAGSIVPSMQLITAGVANGSIDARAMYSGGYTNMVGLNGEAQRVATGLGWAQSGNDFGWGGFTQQETLDRFIGKGWASNSILAQAAKGVSLGGNAITLANGSKIDKLQGMEAINWLTRQESYAEQQFSIGQQLKSADLSFAFTTGQGLSKYGSNLPAGGAWGLEQRQMELGWKQQEFGFQMQEKQMALSTSQFNENMGVNKKQTMMQRGWAQEDWGFNAQVRDLQWGWKQQDYAEESRFMTGRQRRLADRQMQRDTTMHDIEGNQIDRQINRQKESWKLEDERIGIQKKQFEESKKLQEEQLQANRKFFAESKKLQLDSQALQHAQFLAQHKLQLEGITYTQKHSAIMNDLQNKLQLAKVAADQYQVQINNIGAIGIAGMIAWAEKLSPAITNLLQPFQDLIDKGGIKLGNTSSPYNPSTSYSTYNPISTSFAGTTKYIPATNTKAATSMQQTIYLNADGQTLQRWVVNTIAQAQ